MDTTTENSAPPTEITLSEDALRKIFGEDLTRSQFEREKTKRIAALCEALKFMANLGQPGNYGERSPRAEIMAHLAKVCESSYEQGAWRR